MLDPRTLIAHCIAGTAGVDDFDDWVDRWHASQTDMPLHDYLGLTFEEYGNVVLAPAVLPHVVEIRRMVEGARLSLLHGIASSSQTGMN